MQYLFEFIQLCLRVLTAQLCVIVDVVTVSGRILGWMERQPKQSFLYLNMLGPTDEVIH